MEKKKFDELYSIDINPHIEKDYKGLSYLSWATAYKLAMDSDPEMTYEIVQDNDGMPFFSRGNVHIVKTKVTMFGETKEMFLPIMDNKHNAVDNPNARQVNDNIMRCLAKNIAMFGIGLPLYVGEDLKQFKQYPAQESKVEPDTTKIGKAKKMILDLIGDNDDLLEKQLEMQGLKCLNDANENQLRIIYKNLQMELKKIGAKNGSTAQII